MKCRICDSDLTTTLPIGQYAEFFRLRVDTLKDQFLLFSRTGSITTKPISLATRASRKSGEFSMRILRSSRPYNSGPRCRPGHAVMA